MSGTVSMSFEDYGAPLWAEDFNHAFGQIAAAIRLASKKKGATGGPAPLGVFILGVNTLA